LLISKRFIKDEFNLGQEPTLGVGFNSKAIEVDNTMSYNFCIWDTAG
jgi:GTPase SAR1 family protein